MLDAQIKCVAHSSSNIDSDDDLDTVPNACSNLDGSHNNVGVRDISVQNAFKKGSKLS